jgi:uncharacterized protein (DUF924 family)
MFNYNSMSEHALTLYVTNATSKSLINTITHENSQELEHQVTIHTLLRSGHLPPLTENKGETNADGEFLIPPIPPYKSPTPLATTREATNANVASQIEPIVPESNQEPEYRVQLPIPPKRPLTKTKEETNANDESQPESSQETEHEVKSLIPPTNHGRTRTFSIYDMSPHKNSDAVRFHKTARKRNIVNSFIKRVLTSRGSETRSRSISRISLSEEQLVDDILGYMVHDDMTTNMLLWFGKDSQTDLYITQTFGEHIGVALKGEYDHWVNSARSAVALIILLDQFSRNVFRDTPQMYAADPKCLEITKLALHNQAYYLSSTQNQLMCTVSLYNINVPPFIIDPSFMVFICLVLTHSENIEDQRRCCFEWHRCLRSADLHVDHPLHEFTGIFYKHLHVIESFGRFPHRNIILSRPTSRAEKHFLAVVSHRFDLPMKKTETGQLQFVTSHTSIEKKQP